MIHRMLLCRLLWCPSLFIVYFPPIFLLLFVVHRTVAVAFATTLHWGRSALSIDVASNIFVFLSKRGRSIPTILLHHGIIAQSTCQVAASFRSHVVLLLLAEIAAFQISGARYSLLRLRQVLSFDLLLFPPTLLCKVFSV